MHETEIKLQVPADRRAAVEAALSGDATPGIRLRATYFDTADRRLAAQNMALRLRHEGDRWVQTLKAASGDAMRRFEHNVELEVATGDAVAAPALDISRHDGTPAGALLRAALGGRGEREPLLALYTTDILRRRQWVAAPGGEVEIAFDAGTISAAGRTETVCEIELEAKGAAPAALVGLARRWVLEHGLWLSTAAKSGRGDRLSRGIEAAAAHATAPHVDRTMAGDAVLGATLDACLTHVLGNASEVAAGITAEESVHQLRVGIRRLRTALRELGPLADGIDPAWEEALVAVFRQLGQLRDRETVTLGVDAELAAAGAPPIRLPLPTLAAPDIRHAVRAVGFQIALLGLIGLSFDLEAGAGSARRAESLRHVRRRLGKLHRQITRDGQQFEKLPVAAQHQVRKRLKRLRYLSEFVAPLFKRRKVAHYLDALRPAQDALGLRNDAAVALEAYRDAAAHDPQAWFAVGWLSAQSDASARRCRKALRAIESAPRFWER